MANEEQLKFMRQGPDAWNAWRDNPPPMRADLAEADLREAELPGVDLRFTNLVRANLQDANLREAELARAFLSGANFTRANLFRANLTSALVRTDLAEAIGVELTAPGRAIQDSIQRLGTSETKDVQQIAASQLELLTAYHQMALGQSNRSFFWALIGSGIGLLLFVVAVGFSLLTGLSLASIVPLIAGAVVEVVSGLVFYLCGRTSLQLSAFHSRLEVLQRHLLANSICESLGEAERDKARSALIAEISRGQPTT